MKTTNSCLVVSLILLVVILIASFQNTLSFLYVALAVLPLMFVVLFINNRAQRKEDARLVARMRENIRNLRHHINIQ